MRRAGAVVNQGGLALVYKWRNSLHSILFPAHCRLCLAPGSGRLALCAACRNELPWQTAACRRCALPLAPGSGDGVCAGCLADPPPLDSCNALFGYHAPVDQWIHALKFRRDLAISRLLGELLAERIAAPSGEHQRLLAVPLHARRLRQRGYNQAAEIARALRARGWRPSRSGCHRRRHTDAQSELAAPGRRANLRGAFGVRRPAEGEHILVIDDVMTTGSTLYELAATLKANGAARVDAWVIARTLKS